MYAVNKIEINLTVPSLEETIEWYARVLGWSGGIDTYDALGRGTFGDVVCGERIEDPSGKEPSMGFNLERYSGDPEAYPREHPAFSAFIKVDDVDAVYARVQASGTPTDGSPQDQLWGGRLFSIFDLNGFHLIFYQMVEQLSIEEVIVPEKSILDGVLLKDSDLKNKLDLMVVAIKKPDKTIHFNPTATTKIKVGDIAGSYRVDES